MEPAVTWISAMLDLAGPDPTAIEGFWAEVTGAGLSPRLGPRGELVRFLPPDGDPCVKAQRIEEPRGSDLHLDLYGDVAVLGDRVAGLGADVEESPEGHLVCRSPAGTVFCVVDHPAGRVAAPVGWPGGRSAVDQVCLDLPPSTHDAEVDFWRALTGWHHHDVDGHPELQRLDRPPGGPHSLLLQRLDEEQEAATAHLDLSADDRDGEVERHVALGAGVLQRFPGWTVLADPSGRRYCVTDRVPGEPGRPSGA